MTKTKTLPKTSDLLTATMLSKEFDRGVGTIVLWLEEANVHPAITMPYGKGFMRLYEPAPAREAIRAKMPKQVPPAAPAPAAPIVDLGVLEERVENLGVQMEKLQEQNRALFAYIRDHIGDPVSRLVGELGGSPT